MAELYPKRLSFQAGEISPLSLGRSDLEIYEKGLSVAENIIIDKRGGAFKRSGLEHLGRVIGDNARLFSLQISRQRYYTIILHKSPTAPVPPSEFIIVAPGAKLIGNNLLLNGNFANAGANWSTTLEPASSQVLFTAGEAKLVPAQTNPEIVTNPNFNQGGTGWTVRESHAQSDVTFANNQVTLTPRAVDTEYAGITQALVTTTPNEVHQLSINGLFSSNNLTVKVGTAVDDGTYLDTTITDNSVLSFTPTATNFVITLDCIYPDVLITLDDVSVRDPIEKFAQISQQATVIAAQSDLHLVIVGQASNSQVHVRIGTTEGDNDIAAVASTSGEISLQFVPNSPTYWVSVRVFGDEEAQATINIVATAADAVTVHPLGLTMDAPWSEDQFEEVHITQAPGGQKLYFTHPNVAPQQLIYSFATDTFVNLAPVPFVNPPAAWAGTNYPSTGTHYQGRLWLAGTPDERQTVWASKSGDDLDFTDSGSSLDDDPLEFVLQDFGRIEWLLGTKNLLIGAENGEHLITSQGGVITQSDSNVQKQSSYGSNNVQAIQVGEQVFYITPDGRQLRAMAYEWQEDNWLSKDLTFFSEHITRGLVRHIAWAQYPNNLFIMVLQDGTVAVLTFDRSAQTVAWTHITIPGMKVLDVTSGRSNGVNEIALVGQRQTGMIDFETNSENKEFLDSYAGVFDEAGTNVITGLDHLEGLMVRPLVDGAVDPMQTVVGGQITTQTTGKQLFAGIAYTAKMVTLPLDVQGSQIRSFTKRWNKVWALVNGSNVPIINGTRGADRTPSTPMDTVEPPTNGHFRTVSLGWDDFGAITIEQDLPVAMNILAIYGELNAETL